MLNPKVMVGECSIQVMLRGELVMTIPHRLWESGVDERGELVWSGERRGDHTTTLLARYVEGEIQGCEDQGELFDRLEKILQELRSPKWSKTFLEEEIAKKTKREEREGCDREREAPEGAVLVTVWRSAA
jgi:hypothetical protein